MFNLHEKLRVQIQLLLKAVSFFSRAYSFPKIRPSFIGRNVSRYIQVLYSDTFVSPTLSSSWSRRSVFAICGIDRTYFSASRLTVIHFCRFLSFISVVFCHLFLSFSVIYSTSSLLSSPFTLLSSIFFFMAPHWVCFH